MKVLVLLLAVAVSAASADELKGRKAEPESRIPAHTPEWTNPTTGDPGVKSVAEDLQKIVVLCAKDHESTQFQRAWAAYVRKHKLKDAELEKAKRKVVDEAFRHRQQLGQSRGERKDMIEWKKGAKKSLDATTVDSVDNRRDER